MDTNMLRTESDENSLLPEFSIESRLGIIDEGVRKKYLARLKWRLHQ